jgi:hypothetical protein
MRQISNVVVGGDWYRLERRECFTYSHVQPYLYRYQIIVYCKWQVNGLVDLTAICQGVTSL